MAIGKREQIVLVSIGALLAIFVVHIAVFNPRAKEFERVQTEYKEKVAILEGAEVPVSSQQLPNYENATKKYSDQVTSVVAQLNLDAPSFFKTRWPDPKEKQERFDEVTKLLATLVKMRDTSTRPVLSFLNDRRNNPNDLTAAQMGWNLPSRLPQVGAQGALWDRVVQLESQFVLMNTVSDPVEKVRDQRPRYNTMLLRLGINPYEVCDWLAYFQPSWVPFDDESLVPRVGGRANTLSINRFGVLVPNLKKLWLAELIYQQKDPSAKMSKERLYEILEMKLPFSQNLLLTYKQLQAVIDVIELAQKNGVLEIYMVNLLKPVDLTKASVRVPGQTPAASPTPDPAAPPTPAFNEFAQTKDGGDYAGAEAGVAAVVAAEKIGTGTGIEIYFRATNPVMVQFLFDITNLPRTYALDDLYVQASPDGILNTSTTIEIVTNLENLGTRPQP